MFALSLGIVLGLMLAAAGAVLFFVTPRRVLALALVLAGLLLAAGTVLLIALAANAM